MLTSFTSLLTLVSLARGEPLVVTVPLDALRSPPEAVELAPVRAVIDRLDARVQPGEEARLELSWDLRAVETGWVDLGLVGADIAVSSATLDGRPTALEPGSDGMRHLVARLEGRHVVRLVGTVTAPTRGLKLPIAPPVRGRVSVVGEQWDAEVDGALPAGDEVFDLVAPTTLDVRWKPAAEPAPRRIVQTAQTATALRVDDAGVEGRGRLQYTIRYGEVETLQFRITAPVEGLEVTGPGVRSFEQRGDTVAVQMSRPVRGGVVLEASWRARVPEGEDATPAPLLAVDGSRDAWVSILSGDQSLVVPDPGQGLSPVSRGDVPDWASGLVEGTAIAAYHTGGQPGLAYRVLRYDALEEPPTLVDEVRYEVAYTAHGRLLMRARYQVRNERRQYLHVVPPPGVGAIAARVAGEVVQPVSDGQGGIYVPLEKSVETLSGLVSFPVELTFLGAEDAWARRGRRTLLTPAIDAPIAYARWEVYLPPEHELRRVEGKAKPVVEWTDRSKGLVYGRAYGEGLEDDSEVLDQDDDGRARAGKLSRKLPTEESVDEGGVTEDTAEELSIQAWNSAYRAYKDNRFDEAAQLLNQSLELDPDNAAAQALQGNVDLLLDVGGKDDKNSDEVVARRVKEMARAKTASVEIAQEDLKKKAEEKKRAGDYRGAQQAYEELVDVTRSLARVEQAESFEQKQALSSFEAELADLSEAVQAEDEEEERREVEEATKSGLASILGSTSTTSSSLGGRGSGLGGGGTADGIGGLGTKGRGSGASGYGSGGGGFAAPAGTVTLGPTGGESAWSDGDGWDDVDGEPDKDYDAIVDLPDETTGYYERDASPTTGEDFGGAYDFEDSEIEGELRAPQAEPMSLEVYATGASRGHRLRNALDLDLDLRSDRGKNAEPEVMYDYIPDRYVQIFIPAPEPEEKPAVQWKAGEMAKIVATGEDAELEDYRFQGIPPEGQEAQWQAKDRLTLASDGARGAIDRALSTVGQAGEHGEGADAGLTQSRQLLETLHASAEVAQQQALMAIDAGNQERALELADQIQDYARAAAKLQAATEAVIDQQHREQARQQALAGPVAPAAQPPPPPPPPAQRAPARPVEAPPPVLAPTVPVTSADMTVSTSSTAATAPAVTASQLAFAVPKAGQRLRFEQRLVPEDTPLSVELSHKSHR